MLRWVLIAAVVAASLWWAPAAAGQASCVERPVVARFDGELLDLTELAGGDDADAVARVRDPDGAEILVRVQGDIDLLEVGDSYDFSLLDDIDAPYATVGQDDECPPNDSILALDGSELEAGTPVILRFLIIVAACTGAAIVFLTRSRRKKADDEPEPGPKRNHGRRLPWDL